MFLPLSLAVPPIASMVRLEIGIAHVMILRLPLRFGFHVVGIVKHDPPLLQRADVVFVRMLIEGQQHVGLVARAQHLARADAHLEDGRPARKWWREWS